jgi:hypothetical protein
MPTPYSRSECLNTLETIELSLDFSIGQMTGQRKLCHRDLSRLEVGLFSEQKFLSL